MTVCRYVSCQYRCVDLDLALKFCADFSQIYTKPVYYARIDTREWVINLHFCQILYILQFPPKVYDTVWPKSDGVEAGQWAMFERMEMFLTQILFCTLPNHNRSTGSRGFLNTICRESSRPVSHCALQSPNLKGHPWEVTVCVNCLVLMFRKLGLGNS